MDNRNAITTTGLFGFFDILGYSSLILKNDMHYFKKEILGIFHSLDFDAISLMGLDDHQILDWRKVGSKVFSDTIILYQEEQKNRIDEQKYVWGSSFFVKCSLLNRIAFDNGLPLRGAISYGEYYVDEKCVFGKPIIEACNEEKNSNGVEQSFASLSIKF